MPLSNDLFSNMFRSFGFPNNPFIGAFNPQVPSNNSATTQAAPAVSAGAMSTNELLKQSLESQVKLMTAMTACALASTEKVIELNINAARTSVQENFTLANQVIALKSTRDLQLIFAALPQATSTKAIIYGHHLTSIAADACTELARSTQSEVAELTGRMCSLLDQVSKNMPAGSENVVALTKAVVTTANSGYEQAVKTTEHAAQTIEESAEHIVNKAVQTTAKATGGNGTRRTH